MEDENKIVVEIEKRGKNKYVTICQRGEDESDIVIVYTKEECEKIIKVLQEFIKGE